MKNDSLFSNYKVTITNENITHEWNCTVDSLDEFIDMVQTLNNKLGYVVKATESFAIQPTKESQPSIEQRSNETSSVELWNEKVTAVLKRISKLKEEVFNMKLNEATELMLLDSNEYMTALRRMREWLERAKENISRKQYLMLQKAIQEYDDRIQTKKMNIRKFRHSKTELGDEEEVTMDSWNQLMNNLEACCTEGKMKDKSKEEVKEIWMSFAKDYILEKLEGLEDSEKEIMMKGLERELDKILFNRESVIDDLCIEEIF